MTHRISHQQRWPQRPVMPESAGVVLEQPADEVNHLLTLATPLITLMTQIKHTVSQDNVEKFRVQVIEEIKLFEQKLLALQYPAHDIMAARYCLCTAIDEAVLGRPWGVQSSWVQNSLLAFFHKERWGGEHFYLVLDRLAKETRRHIDFLEFAYVLLSLGFEGKFFGAHLAVREEIRHRLFYRIRHARKKPDRRLSTHWKSDSVSPKINERASIKRLGFACFGVFLMMSVVFNVMVHDAAKPTLGRLAQLANVSPITAFSELIQRPIVGRSSLRGLDEVE